MKLREIIEAAMAANGADGLFNEHRECGCGIENLNPCDCMGTDCELAKGHAAEDAGDTYDVGEWVWSPITDMRKREVGR